MADEDIKLQLDLADSAAKARELDKALDGVEKSAEKVATAGDKAAKSTLNMGQAALQGGRALQDFGQGGIGGILNNIEGLVSALGGSAGLAGVLTAVGLAAYFALPPVKAWFTALIEGANEIPKAKDKLQAMGEELGKVTKELDGLKDKHVLTNKELQRFNELAEKATRLQGELTAAKKRDADFEKLRQTRTDEEKETASILAEFIGNDIDALRAEITAEVIRRGAAGGTLKELNARLALLVRTQAPPGAIAQVQGAVNAERQRLAEEADKQVQRGLGGNAGDLGMMMQWLPANSRFRRGLGELTPDARRQQDAEIEADEARGQAMIEAGRKRRAKEAAGRKLAEDLNQRGRDNQEAGEKDQEQEKKQDAAKAKKDDDAFRKEAYEFQARKYKEQVETVKSSDIDERAALMAARMRQAGGVMDANNNFQKATPQEQEEQLAKRIGEQIRQMFPHIGGGARGIMASNMAREANQQIDDGLMQAQASAVREGLNATLATQQAMAQMTNEFWQLAQQARRLQQNVRQGPRQRQQPMANNGWG